jgi:hypothetical protein
MKDAFEAYFPGQTFTYYDSKKTWKDAPTSLKQRFYEFGCQEEGQWCKFLCVLKGGAQSESDDDDDD